jgi:SOS-response transcriptional repressor LexA
MCLLKKEFFRTNQEDAMQAHCTLAQLRKDAGLTQADAASHLTQRGCPVTHRAVSKWEQGNTQPNMEQFLLLLELYDVRDVLTAFGMGKSRTLNERGRARLREYAGLLALDEKFCARTDVKKPSRVIPLFDLPVSAGSGQFLDGEYSEPLQVGEDTPERADFAVRVRGDSMMPRFRDGQFVFVEKRPSIEKGDFGVFVLNGEAYIKELGGEGQVQLISLNPAYAPIPVNESDELTVIGRVLG